MSDRYIVCGTFGYGEATGNGNPPSTVYFVVDRYYCYRECAIPVRTHARTPSATIRSTPLRRIAERACALLLWDEALDARAGRGLRH